MEKRLLEILEKNSRISVEQLAAMLDASEEEIVQTLNELEEKKTILGYYTVVDWKTDRELVTALMK